MIGEGLDGRGAGERWLRGMGWYGERINKYFGLRVRI